MKPAILKYTISIAAFVSLAGCATSQPALQGQLSAHLGAAVQANMAAHAVAPTARQKADTFIPANPARTALTRTEYEEGKTAKPKASGY